MVRLGLWVLGEEDHGSKVPFPPCTGYQGSVPSTKLTTVGDCLAEVAHLTIAQFQQVYQMGVIGINTPEFFTFFHGGP